MDSYFYVVSPSRAKDKPFYRAKAAIPLFLSYFKTLSINPFPGTEHATSCYAVQASVVQRLDSAIHRINHYPVDSAISFPNTYPLDSDLSDG